MLKKLRPFWLTLLFLGSALGGFAILQKIQGSRYSDAVEIDWRMLADFDYISGQSVNTELMKLDSKLVRIPGFMVPLEDNMKKVKEFLLVPTPQACIHVPPPPPNQMILVQMKNESDAQFGPIWIYGNLQMKSIRHLYGESSFQMEGLSIEPYR